MQIQGTVVYVDLSGGFYGIQGDDGTKYHPNNPLPKSFCKDGLKVKANVSPASGFSIFMWGQSVNVQHIEKHSSDKPIKKI